MAKIWTKFNMRLAIGLRFIKSNIPHLSGLPFRKRGINGKTSDNGNEYKNAPQGSAPPHRTSIRSGERDRKNAIKCYGY